MVESRAVGSSVWNRRLSLDSLVLRPGVGSEPPALSLMRERKIRKDFMIWLQRYNGFSFSFVRYLWCFEFNGVDTNMIIKLIEQSTRCCR